MNKDFYIYIRADKNNYQEMVFGVLPISYEKAGYIGSDWEIKDTLFGEKEIYIIMDIKKQTVVFVNLFETNQLIWFYEDLESF